MNADIANLVAGFTSQFKRAPKFSVRAPGRVNLIGEHTDYNGGLVLPMAIERKIEILFSPRDDSRVNLYSSNFDEQSSFTLEQKLEKSVDSSWSNYVKGVADVLQRDGLKLKGFDGLIFGDIPVASGLSSSAAIEVAAVLTFLRLSGQTTFEAIEIAKFAQQAEREFVGVNCGLMDQFICVAAVEGHALKIQCDTMDFEPIRIPDTAAIVVADTKLSRTLAGSAYNQRRAECDSAFELIKENLTDRFDIRTMKDIGVDVVEASQAFLSPVEYRRVRHFATENWRVEEAARSLKDGDLSKLGLLMNASHESLKTDYEVSSKGLDDITSIMRATKGCYGARLTGAGFGGCAIAVVDSSRADRFIDELDSACINFEPQPEFFRTNSVVGGSVVELRAE